jgi:hypothetical protein
LGSTVDPFILQGTMVIRYKSKKSSIGLTAIRWMMWTILVKFGIGDRAWQEVLEKLSEDKLNTLLAGPES